MKIKKINLNEEGLLRFFGSLEVKIMEVLWNKNKLTIKQMHEILNNEEPISLNAVMTVMIRLADKGHLLKESTGNSRNRVTFFSQIQNKEQFILEQTKVVTDELVEDFGSLMVSHLIDNLDKADANLLQRFEQKLIEMKSK